MEGLCSQESILLYVMQPRQELEMSNEAITASVAEIAEDEMRKLVEHLDTPNLYLNGAALGLSLSDIKIVGMVDGKPQCQLHMSFTTAKSVASGILEALGDLERMTKLEVPSMETVKMAMAPDQAQPPRGEGK